MFIEHVALCFVEPDEIRYMSLKKLQSCNFISLTKKYSKDMLCEQQIKEIWSFIKKINRGIWLGCFTFEKNKKLKNNLFEDARMHQILST